MDIWEANKMSAALTPHPCTTIGQSMCDGNDCGGTYSTSRYGGECDPDGCDFNSYRQGNTTFYGPGLTVDTTSKFTVVTQFLTDSTGDLSEIKRFYVQNNKVIPNSYTDIAGTSGNSITTAYCNAQKTAFGDTNDFSSKGGLVQMGAALSQGMVLVMSLWDDHYADMLWLDSTYPTNGTSPGDFRGSCATTSGVPTDVESNAPNSNVIYSNIKFGPINSTFTGTTGPPGGGSSSSSSVSSKSTSTSSKSTSTSKTTSTTTSAASGPTGTGVAQRWGQCGGTGWTGPTTCASPYTCTYSNPWYSQCL